MKAKTREMFKKVGLALLAVGIIGGTVALGNKLYHNAKSTERSFNPNFEVGGLVELTGDYENDSTTVYTKEAFKAKGLKVKIDIDKNVAYRVFFYDESDVFLSCTEEYYKSQAIDVPAGQLIRIEMGPRLGKNEVAPELSRFDAYKYSKIMTLTIDKNQSTTQPPRKPDSKPSSEVSPAA